MKNIIEKLNNLSEDELLLIEKGKNHWKNMDVVSEYKSGRITTETLKNLIDLIVEDVWVNAHDYYSNPFIDYKGYRYWYEKRTGKHRIDICLATKNPQEYCNGFYLYSAKDPGSGLVYVVTKTNNPNPNWMDNI